MSAAPAVTVANGAAASSPANFEIRVGAGGRLEARGMLTFSTARRARELGLEALHASSARELEVDCAGITAADSAGLAVLLDWLAAVKRESRGLRYLHLPVSLMSIAAISDLDELLRRGIAA
jgi:phospholipid transport system transporter-binding protein